MLQCMLQCIRVGALPLPYPCLQASARGPVMRPSACGLSLATFPWLFWHFSSLLNPGPSHALPDAQRDTQRRRSWHGCTARVLCCSSGECIECVSVYFSVQRHELEGAFAACLHIILFLTGYSLPCNILCLQYVHAYILIGRRKLCMNPGTDMLSELLTATSPSTLCSWATTVTVWQHDAHRLLDTRIRQRKRAHNAGAPMYAYCSITYASSVFNRHFTGANTTQGPIQRGTHASCGANQHCCIMSAVHDQTHYPATLHLRTLRKTLLHAATCIQTFTS